ncbi:hypothetical protein [Paraburkholderia phenazinium]|uniref:Uncharacterized protein n=1 Tax=Paraburkholderia phenazinium TaxID=60549 RepID=A0A1G8J9P4_9BURK|nr:hypothetical protein [Paraburkholderia phenazinium]SDI27717.1 hypothetical protein SAMN05216466_12010 [Paraburkholderia phenazinium]
MLFRPRTTRIPFKLGEKKRKLGQRIELDLSKDRHARAAVEAYADSCSIDMPWLAQMLRHSAPQSAGDLSLCAATVRRVFGLAQDWAASQPDYAQSAWEHVRIHLEAALNHQLKQPEDDESEDGEYEAEGFAPIRMD